MVGMKPPDGHHAPMEKRILRAAGDGTTSLASDWRTDGRDEGWEWADVIVTSDDLEDLAALTAALRFDALAVLDAVADRDLPKVDDFGHHLLVVLHGLRDDQVATYEIDCFVTERHLVTVRRSPAPALDALWDRLLETPELAAGGVDTLVARLADVLSRRLLSVLNAFDDRAEELLGQALAADPRLLGELTAVRTDLAAIRRVVHPQREALDELRYSTSPLISAAGRRRFSDVFDVAARTSHGLDAARASLAEILDAYRGAEARLATNVTKVLTIYAAIMLPLSLVAGFFGMNFKNLPGIGSEWGWVIVTGLMVAIAALSLGVFVAIGWIERPSGRRAGETLGRGLIQATRAPVHVVGAVFELTAMPVRGTATRIAGSTRVEANGNDA